MQHLIMNERQPSLLPQNQSKHRSSLIPYRRFTNGEIERRIEFPKDYQHEDYKYLITSEGPLVQTKTKPPNGSVMSAEKKSQKIIISVEKKRYGGVRICQWCYKAKPDRCHHCS